MDIDNNNQNEEIKLLNVLIYAVDEYGICHLFDTDTLNQSQSIAINSEEKMDVSTSIVALSNQIDNSLQLVNEALIQNSSNFQSTEYLSTQPFTIFDLHENNISSLINSNENISEVKNKKKKKMNRKLRYPSYQFIILKKQFKAYLKKKKKKQQDQLNSNISNIILHSQSQQIEPSPIEHSNIIDLQLSPDLSKRKYIYKDITLSNNNNNNSNNQNQMNWRIFQCTQQSSSMSCFDQTVTNDCNYHPFYNANNPISLPDIRIGLSRHHSTKHLHKTIID